MLIFSKTLKKYPPKMRKRLNTNKLPTAIVKFAVKLAPVAEVGAKISLYIHTVYDSSKEFKEDSKDHRIRLSYFGVLLWYL